MVEIGWIYTDTQGCNIKSDTCLVVPDGFSIPDESTAIHGITTEDAIKSGVPLKIVLAELTPYLWSADLIVGHNLFFDMGVIRAEQVRMGMPITPMNVPTLCTLEASTEFCGIPGLYGGFKWPKLSELHSCLFGEAQETAHRALDDVTITRDCFFELVKRGIVSCP
jgi:DNA polymerase III epsilon subunit-like protein